MEDLSLILLAAGSSSRFQSRIKKQWLRIGKDPFWLFVLKRFEKMGLFSKIVVTGAKEEINYMQAFTTHTVTEGGATRQESMKKALSHVSSRYVLVTDVARCCFHEQTILELITHKDQADCIVPVLAMSDTVTYQNLTIDRDEVKRIQTPQLSKTQKLREALELENDFTDDSTAIVNNGGTRYFIAGTHQAAKLTYPSELKSFHCLIPPSNDYFVGNGFDVHPFETDKPMVLGGINIDSDFGFKAHSDGDVAIHALIDALLGAAGMGDIGTLFPDNDAQYKNIDSKKLLTHCVDLIGSVGFVIVNCDITIMAQTPRLEPYKHLMKYALAKVMGIEPVYVNIKATTTEKLGFVGRKEGVAVQASAVLKFFDWNTL